MEDMFHMGPRVLESELEDTWSGVEEEILGLNIPVADTLEMSVGGLQQAAVWARARCKWSGNLFLWSKCSAPMVLDYESVQGAREAI
jgi:hypothetical protein